MALSLEEGSDPVSERPREAGAGAQAMSDARLVAFLRTGAGARRLVAGLLRDHAEVRAG